MKREEYDHDPAVERGFKLLSEHAQGLRHFAANPRKRIPTGIPSLDLLTMGPAAGEVYMFCGRSHTGKSLIATNIMANNPSLGGLFFSLEMPSHQVMERLYAHVSGRPSSEVGRMIRDNTLPDSLESEFGDYARHVIIDSSHLTLGDMSAYCGQYDAYFGQRPDFVIIDYLEEVGGSKSSGEGWVRTEATASSLKAWSRTEQMPVFVLHQSNKSEKAYEPVTEDSPKGGGFTEADVFIGLWRPGRNPELGQVERYALQYEMWMNVIKNRISNKLTMDDLRFRITKSGLLSDLSIEKVREFYGTD